MHGGMDLFLKGQSHLLSLMYFWRSLPTEDVLLKEALAIYLGVGDKKVNAEKKEQSRKDQL